MDDDDARHTSVLSRNQLYFSSDVPWWPMEVAAGAAVTWLFSIGNSANTIRVDVGGGRLCPQWH